MPAGEWIKSHIPARLDRLPWSRWHWLVVLASNTLLFNLPTYSFIVLLARTTSQCHGSRVTGRVAPVCATYPLSGGHQLLNTRTFEQGAQNDFRFENFASDFFSCGRVKGIIAVYLFHGLDNFT